MQREVVNAQQVQAAAEAARAQQFAQTMQELSRQRREQQALRERREDRTADIRRQEAADAEGTRRFEVNTGLARERLTAEKEAAGVGRKETDERELYNNLLNFIEKTGNIPTTSEWEAQIVDISDARKKELRKRRDERFALAVDDFNLVTGEVARLNAKLEKKEKNDKGDFWTAEQLWTRSPYKKFIDFDPDGGLRATTIKPRVDATAAPPPFRVPERGGFEREAEPLEDFDAVKSAVARGELLNVGVPTGAEPIASVLGRLNRPSVPAATQLPETLLMPGGAGRIPGLPELAPPAAPESPGFFRRMIDMGRGAAWNVGDYLGERVAPPVAGFLNRLEIGPDLTGNFPKQPQYPIVSPPLPMPSRPQFQVPPPERTKGLGYFGELNRPDGRVSTELSIGVDFDGRETQIPSIVPTLARDELDHLLSGGAPTPSIVDKAVRHARERLSRGMSPFAQPGEQITNPAERDFLAPPVFAPGY